MEVNKKSIPGAIRDRKDIASCFLVDWTSQHAQGQKLYRARKFEDALKCFTLALKACPDAPLMVRDNRAAAYIKAGDLTAALRDGRKMIQEAEQNCIGYLRTGKILQLMGQQDPAMKIYKLGLDKIPLNVDDRELLQVMHSKLLKKLAPQRIDPLRALPLELIEMILRDLDFREVVHLRRVSKAWQQFVDTMPNLWSDLDFTKACRPICFRTVRKYVDRSKGKVTRVTLSRFAVCEEKIPHYIASRCKELQELRIPTGDVGASVLKAAPCASNLKTLIITSQCPIKSHRVMQLLSLCPNLETADFSSVISSGWRFDEYINSPLPNLRSLIMRSDLESPMRSYPETWLTVPLNELIYHMPNLRKLSLLRWSMERVQYTDVQCFSTSQTLETLIIPGCSIYAPPGPFLPSSLRYLDMGKCTTANASRIGWNAPPTKLVWLSIAGMNLLPFDTFIEWLEPNKGNLSYLDASEMPDYRHNWAGLGEMGYLNKVEELNLSDSEVNDQTIMALSTNLPVLKILHLKHTIVTGVGLKAVVTTLQETLECLYLDGCHKMGLDAVQWARKMGIKVSFTFADDRKRRGRIRSGY